MQSRYQEIMRAVGRLIALLLCLGVAGLWHVPLKAQPLPDRRDLAGRVTSEDGKPVKDAVVTVRQQTDLGVGAFWGAQTVTDDNGEFVIPDAEEGKYYVTVVAKDFAEIQSQSFVLNESSPRLDVRVKRLLALKLRVLKTDGTPLGTAPVSVRLRQLSSETNLAGMPIRSINQQAGTNRQGELTLSGVVPGEYFLSLFSRGAGQAVVDVVRVDAQTINQVVEARLQPGGTLRVRALHSGGEAVGTQRPIGGGILSLLPLPPPSGVSAAGNLRFTEDVGLFLVGNERFALVTADETGTVELSDIVPDRYSVNLLLPGFNGPGAQPVEIKSGETTLLDIPFQTSQELMSLPIAVVDEEGKPLGNMEWNLQLRQISSAAVSTPPPAIPGQPTPAAMFAGSGLRRGKTGANGKTTLYPIQPGLWRFVLSLLPDGNRIRNPIAVSQEVDVTRSGKEVTIQIKIPGERRRSSLK